MIVLGIFWIVRLWEASIYVCKEQHFRIHYIWNFSSKEWEEENEKEK
jgi:hypothetical protein